MRGAQRNKLAAVAVFVLLAAVVVGGMGWATASSLELAQTHILEQHNGKILRAVNFIDSYMGGILNSEAARDWTDYQRDHVRQAVAVWSDQGIELEAALVRLQSPLVQSGPPHDWIDLYFQVDQDGLATSPQLADVPPSGSGRGPLPHGCDPRICRTWQWFAGLLSSINLDARVAEAFEEDRTGRAVTATGPTTKVVRLGSRDKRSILPGSRLGGEQEYDLRRRSLRDTQAGYLPPPECVTQHVADSNIRHVRQSLESMIMERPAVNIRADEFAPPFWLKPQPLDGPKLAFVRRCYADAAMFHQGFIGDWKRLRASLLDQLKALDLFPELELVPVANDARYELGMMINLPVRLEVPDATERAAMLAWHQVRGTLIGTWLVAGAVLVVAGMGLRNLVALTERRMQFAYAVTHELRTPLTTFRLYADMLSAGLVPKDSQQEYVDTLNRESQRLSSLVEGVLEYARLENHKVRLNPVETDAPTLLATINENFTRRCQENGIEPRTENAVLNGQKFRTDVDVVNRIAGVLVNNACRHAGSKDQGAVLVRLADEDGKLLLDVIDNGPGVDRADARSIFKPFRRGRGADKAAQGGIGLGLALARSWAGLLGGRLDLAARRHPQYGGAHFRLTIPAASQN